MCLCLLASSVSAGQLLCSGLFSSDGLSTWFAAVALLHAIVENSTQKEQLLRVQLATSLGHPPVSLLQQCTNILTQVGSSIIHHCVKLWHSVFVCMFVYYWNNLITTYINFCQRRFVGSASNRLRLNKSILKPLYAEVTKHGMKNWV